jgi:ribulose-5-phosphate 4-epimerase/fuculose-1-phosphate aldolase
VNKIFKISKAVADLVNPLNKANSTVRDILIPPKLTKEVIRESAIIQSDGLSCGNMGEISVRLPGTMEKCIINARHSNLSELTEKDLCLVDIHTGKVFGSIEPARHIEWHRTLYMKTDMDCAILFQPPSALIFADRGIPIDNSFWPEAHDIFKKFVCVTEDTEEISFNLQTAQYLLIKGVGLFATGKTLKQTRWDVEIIERFCQISIQLSEGKQNASTFNPNKP